MEEDEPSFEARGSSYIGTRVFGTIQTDCSRKALTKLEVATGPGRTVAIRILPGIPITSNMTRRLPTEIDVDIPDHNTRGMAQVHLCPVISRLRVIDSLDKPSVFTDWVPVAQPTSMSWSNSDCSPGNRHGVRRGSVTDPAANATRPIATPNRAFAIATTMASQIGLAVKRVAHQN